MPHRRERRNSDVYPCQPPCYFSDPGFTSQPLWETVKKHRWGSSHAVHFYITCSAVMFQNASLIFTTKSDITPWKSCCFPSHVTASIVTAGSRSMLVLACWRPRMSVVVIQKEKKKNIKCLKFMWTATIRKAAALQAVTTVFVLWLKHCSNF